MLNELPPVGLAGAGRRLWLAVWESGSVPLQHREILLLACKQADRAAECRETLGKTGLTQVDRFGVEGPHWAIDVERKASATVAQLLKQILGASEAGKVKSQVEEDLFG